ncbi:MAG: hypothetical protein KA217_01605 [Gammaproteobacteria bacterium]|nr:hypothetical protein [Gammaproteobacteria bacterium]
MVIESAGRPGFSTPPSILLWWFGAALAAPFFSCSGCRAPLTHPPPASRIPQL